MHISWGLLCVWWNMIWLTAGAEKDIPLFKTLSCWFAWLAQTILSPIAHIVSRGRKLCEKSARRPRSVVATMTIMSSSYSPIDDVAIRGGNVSTFLLRRALFPAARMVTTPPVSNPPINEPIVFQGSGVAERTFEGYCFLAPSETTKTARFSRCYCPMSSVIMAKASNKIANSYCTLTGIRWEAFDTPSTFPIAFDATQVPCPCGWSSSSVCLASEVKTHSLLLGGNFIPVKSYGVQSSITMFELVDWPYVWHWPLDRLHTSRCSYVPLIRISKGEALCSPVTEHRKAMRVILVCRRIRLPSNFIYRCITPKAALDFVRYFVVTALKRLRLDNFPDLEPLIRILLRGEFSDLLLQCLVSSAIPDRSLWPSRRLLSPEPENK